MKPTSILTTSFAAVILCGCASLRIEAAPPITLNPIGSVSAGEFLTSAAEIAAYDPATRRVFVVNAQAAIIDVIDIADPTSPSIVAEIDVKPYGAVANSVAVRDGLIAVAVEAADKTEPGKAVFFRSDATLDFPFVSSVQVGSLPDMLTFTPNGRYVLTANEGEANLDYSVDPEGSVSIIDLSGGAENLTQAAVKTAGFGGFASVEIGVRIFGPNASIAQDLEPEYIAVSPDSTTAWVTLQENNAIGIIDIPSATVTAIKPLGLKDHNLEDNAFGSGNALDPSDRDGGIKIRNWPVKGVYMPDGIVAFQANNQTYLVLANEGDAREYDTYVEELRIGSSDYVLDPDVFSAADAAFLKANTRLGRLKTTTASGDIDGDGKFEEIHTFGARSFSIRSTTGALLWDSGDRIERIVAKENPAFFNSNHETNRFDDRSDDKGPEPEGAAVGIVSGLTYAFIGLERVGGVMVFDVSNPAEPQFVQYANNRDFTQPPETLEAGDLGPEGLLFISASDSPNGKPLLVVSNEVSSTTTIYQIDSRR